MFRALRTYKAIISIIDKNLRRFQPMFEAFTQCPRSSSSISLSVTMTATSRTPQHPARMQLQLEFLAFLMTQSSWISASQKTKMIKNVYCMKLLPQLTQENLLACLPSCAFTINWLRNSNTFSNTSQSDLQSCLSASILHHILQQHLDASRISGSSSKS